MRAVGRAALWSVRWGMHVGGRGTGEALQSRIVTWCVRKGSPLICLLALRRGCVGRVGSVGSLLKELRAKPSLAPPQLPQSGWGRVSWAFPGGAEVREASVPR
jgi:hypothetical protein